MRRETCPTCSQPVYRSIERVRFSSGGSPVHTVEIVIQAEWCPRPDCYQRIEMHNYHDSREGWFVDNMLHARDALRPIADGEIERGRRVSFYDQKPGKRKITLKDAREIATRTIARMNVAINEFTARIFE